MIMPVNLPSQKSLATPLMDGGLAYFELRGELGAGKQTARAQSLKSARQSIGGPHQRNLPRGKCLLLPVCISKFIESRGDLLIGTRFEKLIDNRHDRR
ncbi:hypothetical protein WJ60_19415 [Burkholderia ubonensis]|nr:hypothetical protein WJ60_19415 [Burkholderia ubonensis]